MLVEIKDKETPYFAYGLISYAVIIVLVRVILEVIYNGLDSRFRNKIVKDIEVFSTEKKREHKKLKEML